MAGIGPHWDIQKRLLRIGLPMGGAALAEVLAFTSIAIFVGRFGASQIAAHQIALNTSSVVFMLPMGLSVALTIRVSQKLGAGDPVARALRRLDRGGDGPDCGLRPDARDPG